MKRGTLDSWLVPKGLSPPPFVAESSPPPTAPSSLSSPTPLPKPDYRDIPPAVLGDLLYLTDFVWTFRKLLRLHTLSVPELRAQVLTSGSYVKALLQAITRELVLETLSRAGEALLSPRLRLLSAIQTCVDVAELSEKLALPLAQELLCAEEDTMLTRMSEYPLESHLYDCYSYEEKMEVLVRLVDLALESSGVHEVLGLRLDEKKELTHKRKELTSQLRALGKDPSVLPQKTQLKEEIKRLNASIRLIPLRTEPLGYDRAGNAYYRFNFDPSRIFVSRNSEDSYWFCYQSRDLQRKLIRAMKAPAEAGLKTALERVLREEYSEMYAEGETEAGGCAAVSREDAVEQVERLETHVSALYEHTGKQWESSEGRELWQANVREAKDGNELGPLLEAFAHKANFPLNQSGSRKGTARLWQEWNGTFAGWNSLMKSTNSYSDIWLWGVYLDKTVAAVSMKKALVPSYQDLG